MLLKEVTGLQRRSQPMVDRDFEYELGSNAPSLSWDIETPHGGGHLYKSDSEWTMRQSCDGVLEIVPHSRSQWCLEFKNTLYWIGHLEKGRLSHWKALERAIEIMAKTDLL
tara:strand:- start:658 stop:990 length:333 start_codon:yes stop_codon:yes gene_type:complete